MVFAVVELNGKDDDVFAVAAGVGIGVDGKDDAVALEGEAISLGES
jgi:hypothetical protein